MDGRGDAQRDTSEAVEPWGRGVVGGPWKRKKARGSSKKALLSNTWAGLGAKLYTERVGCKGSVEAKKSAWG